MALRTRAILIILALYLWYKGILENTSVAFLVITSYLATGGSYTMYLLWHTGSRDSRGAYRYLKVLLACFYYEKRNMTVSKVFSKTASKNPSKTCLIFEDEKLTFREMEESSNRVGNYFLGLGYKRGDTIALFMENCLDYVVIWLGCAKIGLIPALINCNLQGKPFVHSIRAATCIALIYDVNLEKGVLNVADQISDVKLFVAGTKKTEKKARPRNGVTDLDFSLEKSSSNTIPDRIQDALSFRDKLLYIYTSGTTGLPKAAVMKNSRFFFYCCGMCYLNDLGSIEGQVLYDPLPLYHSAGGVVGIGLMMIFGFTVVIRKKFSVRNFWKDCCRHKCTGAQYIGEICRYLLSAPETPEEKQHSVKIMFGNGLRPQIWDEFVQRFGIEKIGEFYGATEGNSSIVNIDSKPGSVGFTSVLLPSIYPVRLIKVDDSGNVPRDAATGLCILCRPGEPGEFVGKIVKNHPSREFDGYADKTATETKIVRNVLKKGDAWFRSGDLLTMDEFGWMYFVDRLGDNFRWRGENVSTIEVEAVLSNILKQRDTIVYGVQIPGLEGRAGMAAIVEPVEGLDLNYFVASIKNQLPSYAIPIFLRMVDKLDITGTFKLRKLALQREGFNPSQITDKIFFFNKSKGVYLPLDMCLYNDIIEMGGGL